MCLHGKKSDGPNHHATTSSYECKHLSWSRSTSFSSMSVRLHGRKSNEQNHHATTSGNLKIPLGLDPRPFIDLSVSARKETQGHTTPQHSLLVSIHVHTLTCRYSQGRNPTAYHAATSNFTSLFGLNPHPFIGVSAFA